MIAHSCLPSVLINLLQDARIGGGAAAGHVTHIAHSEITV